MGVPHLAIPFALDLTGSAATIEQDTPGEVAQCIQLLLTTATGVRIEEPDYGIPDPTFTDIRSAPAAVRTAIARWEPRAADATVEVTADDGGNAAIAVHLPGRIR